MQSWMWCELENLAPCGCEVGMQGAGHMGCDSCFFVLGLWQFVSSVISL